MIMPLVQLALVSALAWLTQIRVRQLKKQRDEIMSMFDEVAAINAKIVAANHVLRERYVQDQSAIVARHAVLIVEARYVIEAWAEFEPVRFTAALEQLRSRVQLETIQ